MRNEEIAEMFDRLANVLEFKGENPFRLNAYRKAARVLRDLRRTWMRACDAAAV